MVYLLELKLPLAGFILKEYEFAKQETRSRKQQQEAVGCCWRLPLPTFFCKLIQHEYINPAGKRSCLVFFSGEMKV